MKKQLFFLVLVTIGFIQLMNAQVPSYVPTNGLVAYWGFTGNANDSSGNAHNGTVNGATLTTDRFGNANSAYSFNGSSNYIAIPHDATFNMQQATWNVWVKKSGSTTGNGMYIFGKRDNTQHHVTFCTGSTNGSCQLGWATAQATGIGGSDITNGWHLLSITYDQSLSSNNLKLYYDGNLQGTATIQSFSFANGDIRFGIEVNNSYWQAFNGLIDDASIYNRILSQTEIQQLYTGPTAVVSCPSLSGTLTNGLVAYYPFCGNANDASGNNNNGTVNGATLTTDRFGNANSAYHFNGNQENIKIQNSLLPSTPTSFTISMWLKYEGSAGSPRDAICDRSTTNYSYKYRLFEGQVNNNPSYFWFSVIDGNPASNVNAVNLSSNWENIIGVVDITSNEMRLYRNGILIGTSTNGYQYPNEANPTYIGSNVGPNSAIDPSYLGMIDDVCVWNRVLTDQEIATLYNQNICYQSVTVTDTLIINTGILSYNPITYNNTVTIYPNPANDHITIDCGTLTNVVGYSIKITNTLGQEVFNQPMNTQQYYVALNSWTGQGVYFVNIIDAQGHTIDVRKIILQ